MNERVDIVMATYNGMPYIREQLQSILWQDYQQFRLLIHDDGSTDGTVEEIRKVAERYPDKVFFIEDGITFKDAKKNFEHLLKMTDAEYIFLADQDDVWLPSKVRVMVQEIEELEKSQGENTPILVFSDYTLINDSNYVLAKSIKDLWNIDPLNPKTVTLELLLSRSIMPGCSIGFNRALLDASLPIPEDAVMHDGWLLLVAAGLGLIKYVPYVLILYRKHSSNLVGVKSETCWIRVRRVFAKPIAVIKAFEKDGQASIRQANAFLFRLKSLLPPDSDVIQLVSEYLDYRSGKVKLKLFFKYAVDGYLWELARCVLWRQGADLSQQKKSY